MSRKRQTIDAAIQSLAPLYEVLIVRALSRQERRSQGATLFFTAPRFVKVVGQTIGDRDTFGDIAEKEDPALLLDDQAEADALRKLRANLLCLAELAGDAHLLLQADVLRRAVRVYQQVVEEDRYRLAEDDPRRLQREASMRQAEKYLPGRGKKGGARKQRSLRRTRGT